MQIIQQQKKPKFEVYLAAHPIHNYRLIKVHLMNVINSKVHVSLLVFFPGVYLVYRTNRASAVPISLPPSLNKHFWSVLWWQRRQCIAIMSGALHSLHFYSVIASYYIAIELMPNNFLYISKFCLWAFFSSFSCFFSFNSFKTFIKYSSAFLSSNVQCVIDYEIYMEKK